MVERRDGLQGWESGGEVVDGIRVLFPLQPHIREKQAVVEPETHELAPDLSDDQKSYRASAEERRMI